MNQILNFLIQPNKQNSYLGDFCLENSAVKSYIDNVTYIDGNYSYTEVTNYVGSGGNDVPATINLQGTYRISKDSSFANYITFNNTIINLVPSTLYYYRKMNGDQILKEGTFRTTNDHVRMINVGGTHNVRDIGGWSSSLGGKLAYEKIYRGGELSGNIYQVTEQGINTMLNVLGITAELDMTNYPTERSYNNGSYLGSSIDWLYVQINGYTNSIPTQQKANLKTAIEFIFQSVASDKPIYVHCQGGNDRTATIIFLIEGILGVSENDLSKDYELSSMLGTYSRTRSSNSYNYKGMVAAIKEYSGTSLTEKFYNYFTQELGIASEAISAFRNRMISM